MPTDTGDMIGLTAVARTTLLGPALLVTRVRGVSLLCPRPPRELSLLEPPVDFGLSP
jgi:hypothetical protein